MYLPGYTVESEPVGGTNRLRITTTAELLKAVELGIVDKTEARGMLGLSIKRGRLARVQPRRAGRFAKSDEVYPLNRFSAVAKDALIEAQDLATADGRTRIETADMLLAVTRQAESTGARALRNVGVTEERARTALAQMERDEAPLGDAGPTVQLKNVVDTAFHAVGYPDSIGTGHLVVALAVCEGTASAVLARLGASEPVLRAEVNRISAPGDPESADDR